MRFIKLRPPFWQICLAFLIVAIILPSCESPSEWTEEDEKGFIEHCIRGAGALEADIDKETYCRCYMEKLQGQFPDPADADNLTLKEYQEYAFECIEEAREGV